MDSNIKKLNELWTNYFREITANDKLKLLVETKEEIVDFLLNCELTRAEMIGGQYQGEYHYLIYLQRNEDKLIFRKEHYANKVSKVQINFLVTSDENELDEIEKSLVEWFDKIHLDDYHTHYEAVRKYGDYFGAFLNGTQVDIADISYADMHKDNAFTISTYSDSYIVIHKDHIEELAKKNMITRMYSEVFSSVRISFKVLTKASGIPAAKIKEMYSLEKGKTLTHEQAEEFLDNHVDTDTYYKKEFDNYGYVGLIGNKKYPEIISGDYYIFRTR